MLAGEDHLVIDAAQVGESFRHRRHLDRFGPGADDRDDPPRLSHAGVPRVLARVPRIARAPR
jgi:hypothetical protein